jgi:hypothetical protein
MTSITQERTGLAAVGVRLRTREQAGLRRSYTDARTVVEPATRAFVHITVSNPSNYATEDAHWRAIEAIGIARFPSTGISYNRGFMQSGTAYEGQPIGRRGAHTVNDFERPTCITPGCPGRGGPLTATPAWNLNYNSRAYVICQNTQHAVTDAQLDAMARVIAGDMRAGFVRRDAEIHGHRCVSAKSCPGDRMWALMATLRARVDHYLSRGIRPPQTSEDDDMYIARFGTTRFRLITDRVFAISEGTFRTLQQGGVSVKVLSNDAIRALEIILNGAEVEDDQAIASLSADHANLAAQIAAIPTVDVDALAAELAERLQRTDVDVTADDQTST